MDLVIINERVKTILKLDDKDGKNHKNEQQMRRLVEFFIKKWF